MHADFIDGLLKEFHETPVFYAEGSQMREHVKRGQLTESAAFDLKGRLTRRFEADFEEAKAAKAAAPAADPAPVPELPPAA